MSAVTPYRVSALVVVAALFVGGCHRSPEYFAPSEPEAAVRSFMSAVAANSLVAMGELWGGERGPAAEYMGREELEKRLTVIRSYLQHEDYEIVASNNSAAATGGEGRVVQVRITRQGCTPVVPITLVRYRSGWLINQIDLEAAGNPIRRCR